MTSLRLKSTQLMVTMTGDDIGEVLTHPAQNWAVRRIAELLTWLESCDGWDDIFEFQRHLFKSIYEVESRRAASAVVLNQARRSPAKVKPTEYLPEGKDKTAVRTWEFEVYLYARLARQLRTVGDALAWQCFGYDRRPIYVLSRHEHAGPMAGKEGLDYELGKVEELWKAQKQFGLLNDLTNCIRISDVSEFRSDGGVLLHEVKKSGRRDPKQIHEAEKAVAAIMEGGEAPGQRADVRLLDVPFEYRSSARKLSDLLLLCDQRGCQGMRLTQARSLFGVSLPASDRIWRADMDQAVVEYDKARAKAQRHAGIDGHTHHILGRSADQASRAPHMVPYSIFPVSINYRVQLICDLAVFETTLSLDHLVTTLQQLGLYAEALLPPENSNLGTEQDILRVRYGDRVLTMHAAGLAPLLFELVDPDTWAAIRYALEQPDPPIEPLLCYAGESEFWS